MAETKERYEKCIENYIPQGGNTTATRHMNSPVLVGSAFLHNARNLHPIKAEAIGEIKFLSQHNTPAATHMNTPVSAFSHNVENLHPIKAEASREMNLLSSCIKQNKVPAVNDSAELMDIFEMGDE